MIFKKKKNLRKEIHTQHQYLENKDYPTQVNLSIHLH